jgi:V/A-type H+-transporting ATPase subunit E
MEQKIQELTDKIFKEGVEKGEAKASEVVSAAEAKAADIVKTAEAKAAQIVADAQKKAEELKRNTESELKLTGTQAISSVKSRIVGLITARVVDDAASKALSDPAILKDFVQTAISNWKMGGGDVPSLEVLLPEAKQDELTKAFHLGVSGELQKGVDVKFSKDVKAGFRIGPADGSFKISLTDEDFKEFFKEYLRPKTRAYLFGE